MQTFQTVRFLKQFVFSTTFSIFYFVFLENFLRKWNFDVDLKATMIIIGISKFQIFVVFLNKIKQIRE